MSTIVGVFAHPDDEAFGPGGTIAKLASEGHEVHVICCTDGNHQDKGLKDVRSLELLASAEVLGVTKVHFLDFMDGSLCNGNYHQVADKVKFILDSLQPETIITFNLNGVSGHIDHVHVASVVSWLFPKLSYLKKIMYFTASKMEVDDYFVYMPQGIDRIQADEIVDIEEFWPVQVRAMKKHVSQKEDCDWLLNMKKDKPKEEYFLVKTKTK